jgi:hypothetical protein
VAVRPNPAFKSRVECSAVLTVGKQCQHSSRKCRRAPCRRSGSRRSRPCRLRLVLSQTFRAADWRQPWMRERPNDQFWNVWKREAGQQPLSGSSGQIDREGQSTPSPRRWPQSCLSATRTSSEMRSSTTSKQSSHAPQANKVRKITESEAYVGRRICQDESKVVCFRQKAGSLSQGHGEGHVRLAANSSPDEGPTQAKSGEDHAVHDVRFGIPPAAMISALNCSIVVRCRMAVCRISLNASDSERS